MRASAERDIFNVLVHYGHTEDPKGGGLLAQLLLDAMALLFEEEDMTWAHPQMAEIEALYTACLQAKEPLPKAAQLVLHDSPVVSGFTKQYLQDPPRPSDHWPAPANGLADNQQAFEQATRVLLMYKRVYAMEQIATLTRGLKAAEGEGVSSEHLTALCDQIAQLRTGLQQINATLHNYVPQLPT